MIDKYSSGILFAFLHSFHFSRKSLNLNDTHSFCACSCSCILILSSFYLQHSIMKCTEQQGTCNVSEESRVLEVESYNWPTRQVVILTDVHSSDVSLKSVSKFKVAADFSINISLLTSDRKIIPLLQRKGLCLDFMRHYLPNLFWKVVPLQAPPKKLGGFLLIISFKQRWLE